MKDKIVVLQHINGSMILGKVTTLLVQDGGNVKVSDILTLDDVDVSKIVSVYLQSPLIFMEDRHPQSGSPIVRIQPWGTTFVEESNDEEVPFSAGVIERWLTPKAGLEKVWMQHTSKLDLTTQLPTDAQSGKGSIVT